MKDNKMLKDKGITLIALVVTIVLLLILVGVTISQISGENGLIRKSKEAVERYKNASEEEKIQLGQLEQYVSDFSRVGGYEGEDKVLVSIKEKGLEVIADAEHNQIIVKITVRGESTGVEYKINSGEEWTKRENEGTVKEENEGDEKETEYTHTFTELALGKSYYIRVKVYDINNKYIEAISDTVILSNIMTAEDEDVLEGETYLAQDGTLRTGTMPNIGEINGELSTGEKRVIPKGYTSGGTITVKTLKKLTPGNAIEKDLLNGKKAWVNGEEITGSMTNYGEKIITGSEVTNDGSYTTLTVPQDGYYNTASKIKGLNKVVFNSIQAYTNRNSNGNGTIQSNIYFENKSAKKITYEKSSIDNYQTILIGRNDSGEFQELKRCSDKIVTYDISNFKYIGIVLEIQLTDGNKGMRNSFSLNSISFE